MTKLELLEKLRSMPPLTPLEQAMGEWTIESSLLAGDIERRYGVVLPVERGLPW